MASPHAISLQYRSSCRLCRRDLAPGATAWWDPASRHTTCLQCDMESPSDPFDPVDGDLRGTAGGSAASEYERRRGKFRHPPRSAEAWRIGAEGERAVSEALHREAGRGRVEVLDDRRMRNTLANIDHLVIAPSGIYVIDTKNYAGRVKRRVEGVWRWRTEHLVVNGRDRTDLANSMTTQVDAVRDALSTVGGLPEARIVPVLCFVGRTNWRLLDAPFAVNGVKVTWTRALTKLVCRDGPLDGQGRSTLTRLLATQLTPAPR